MKQVMIILLRLAVTALLLGFVFQRISLGDALSLVGRADIQPLAIALLLFSVSVVAGAWQWWRLLLASGIRHSLRHTVELYWIGLFFNNFLPGNLGGDVIKVLDLRRVRHDPVSSATATLADRMTGLSALALLAFFAAWMMSGQEAVSELTLPILVGSGLFLLSALAFLIEPLAARFRRLIEVLRLAPAGGRRARILDQLDRLREQRPLLLKLFLFSLLVQGLRVGVHYQVSLALVGAQATPTLASFFLVIPPLAFALTLPVTIGGLGLREGLAIPLFAPLGLVGEVPVALQFLAYLLMLACSLFGGLLYLFRRPGRRAGQAVSDADPEI